MAKAKIRTPEGLEVNVEGSPQEIVAVVNDLQRAKEVGRAAGKRGKASSSRVTLVDLISSLIDGGFFKKPKDLAAIKAALAEMGHVYPMTTLSPAMLRAVRKRLLRRIKENKRWLYTGSGVG